jgi:hypothetical protein
MCYHIDDLHPETEKDLLPSLAIMEEQSLGTLYGEALHQKKIHMVESDMEEIQSPDYGLPDGDHPASMGVDDMAAVRLDHEDDMSDNPIDTSDIEMELDEDEVLLTPKSSSRAQEVPCRRDAGDFQMVDAGFQAMNLRQARDCLERGSVRQRRGSGDAAAACLDIDALMHRCIHKAAAMLKDYEPDTNRKTERVQILIKLLHTTPGNINALHCTKISITL